ncbi:glycosyl hydrolase family 76 [Bacteroidaceae bacterium HV4-6-C5C]|jgi:Predicted glycosyl hydrolase|nr:glycosyl hydrolase family 76 [Bacteroidaceae bacterium HV4-6-C5C]
MNSRISKLLFLMFTTVCFFSTIAAAKETPNKDKAEAMFKRIWELYRVPKYGLFSEYYPGSHRPDLTYFNDSIHRAQEVSYLWPMSGVFSSVVQLAAIEPKKYAIFVDSMSMAVEKYYDTSRVPFGYQAYPVQFGKVDRYYDDNGLVGIDYIDSYMVTKKYHYLEKAKQILAFILSGWDNNFEGAVPWLEGVKDQKPACSNGMAMVLALKLYGATQDEYYLEVGKKFYNWIDKYLKDPQKGVVWNSWKIKTASVESALYTYNTGTLLQGAVLLFQFTGKKTYLESAKFLAEGSYKVFFKYADNGIPYIADLPWFCVVLFRGYQGLYGITGDSKYVDAIIKGLDYAWENARDQAGLMYHDWTGRTDEKRRPKWLLDASCVPEFYARVAIIKGEVNVKK